MLKFKDHFGLDLGSKLIKLVQLAPEGKDKFKLVAFAHCPTPKGENLMEVENAKIELLKKLVRDSKTTTRQVVVNLPEAQVYTRVIELPLMGEEELSQAIRWQAEQYIPVPMAEVVLKHQILSRAETEAEKKMNVLLVAAPTALLNNYLSLLSRAGLEAIAVETEILAVARAVVGFDAFSPNTMLVHLGNDATTISVLERGDLAFTQSISSGGAAITRAIASTLGLEDGQAEEYKCSYGLDSSRLEGKVAEAIKPIVEMILGEIKRALAFYESHEARSKVKRVVLSGGTAFMPNLAPYFTVGLNLEVQVCNPFLSVTLSDKQKAEIGDDGAMYSTAVGLAMKPT